MWFGKTFVSYKSACKFANLVQAALLSPSSYHFAVFSYLEAVLLWHLVGVAKWKPTLAMKTLSNMLLIGINQNMHVNTNKFFCKSWKYLNTTFTK